MTSGSSAVQVRDSRDASACAVIDLEREKRLCLRVVDGDREALGELYEEFREAVFQVAYYVTGSTADAQDILQDVFMALPVDLRQFEHKSALETWLRLVTWRTAMQGVRTDDRRGEVPLPDDIEGRPPPSVDRIDLDRALAALPETLRSVIILKEVEGYSHEEIGDLLDISPSASAVRASRARAALRGALGED